MSDILAHLFLPRSSNNHKAKLIHNSSLIIITLALIFFQEVFGYVQPKSGAVLGYAANISIADVERLTNQKRSENGLPALTDNSTLDNAALAKGKDMLAKGYWAHVAPDGTQPWAFFAAANYSYRYAGENLARDFSSASAAVDAWMASPTHRENLLSPNYKEIGIGVVEGSLAGVDTTIVVQFFGTKLGDTPPASTLANAATATKKPVATVKPSQAPSVTSTPLATIVPILVQTTPLPTETPTTLVASSQVTPFNITRYLSMGLIALLIVVVAVDGFLINKRKIFRIAGHYPAHIAFLAIILIIAIIAKAGRII